MSTLMPHEPLVWSSTARQAAYGAWLAALPAHWGIDGNSTRLASADASFRRYLRVSASGGSAHGSLIVMDAPPDKEDCAPFVKVAALLRDAGINAPEVLSWDAANGFMLLPDMGTQTLMQHVQATAGVDPNSPPFAPQDLPANAAGKRIETLFDQATTALVKWQLASQADVLPTYDDAVLQRELMLFPDWYIAVHKAFAMDDKQKASLQAVFERIKARNLAAPQVFVHRDFMPRNLMMPTSNGAALGVLDFQDALHGPASYDIACLMRDAFWTWQPEFVLDVSIRYWEKARKAGILSNGAWGDWADDFGEFWRAVDYMALQRHLKVAGIFARLTHRDGKARYVADTPRFIAYIKDTCERYGELRPLLRVIDQVEGMDADTTHRRAYGL